MASARGWLDVLAVVRRGAGPPLLLLHGGGGALDGAPFFDALARRFEIIAPTHPGFAATPVPEDCDSIDDLAYLYLDLMESLDLAEIVLMGFSIGGWIAAEVAVKSTARLARLVLVDAVGIKVGDRETRDIADVFIHSPAEIDRLMFHDPANAPDPAAMSEEALRLQAHDRQSLALYGWEPYMHNPKLPGRLHRIDVPTRLIWGESDGIVGPAYGAAYRDLIPGADLVVIPEAGHLPHIERPDEFVRRVLEFAG